MKSYWIPNTTPISMGPREDWIEVKVGGTTSEDDWLREQGAKSEREAILRQLGEWNRYCDSHDDLISMQKYGEVTDLIRSRGKKPDLAKEIFYQEYCKPPRIDRLDLPRLLSGYRGESSQLVAEKLNELIDAVNKLRDGEFIL